MTIFRSKKDGHLYKITHERPPKYTGSWYNAHPLFPDQGKFQKSIRVVSYGSDPVFKDFVAIATR